jgi:hypothetical protein
MLQQLNFSVIEGQYFLSPASAFWLFFASIIFELPQIVDKKIYIIIFIENFHCFLFSCLFGVLINSLSFFVIQCTSSLSLKIIATIRNQFIILIQIFMFSEVVNLNQCIGNIIAVIGFVSYNLSKQGYYDTMDYCLKYTPNSKFNFLFYFVASIGTRVLNIKKKIVEKDEENFILENINDNNNNIKVAESVSNKH